MATTFALVATYQYYENYAIDADGNVGTGSDAHWKAKGGHEAVIAEGITVDEAAKTSPEEWYELVRSNGPECNDVADYHLLDWELVELNSALIADVTDHIDEMAGEDVGYQRFCWGKKGTEFAFDWALAQLDKEAA